MSRNANSANRVERWVDLNNQLSVGLKSIARRSADSHITWAEMKQVYNIKPFIQTARQIDQANFDILRNFLSCSLKCLSSLSNGMSSSIAAVLSCVCAQFNGEAKIHFDETLEGEYIKAVIDFGFILRRHDVLVCVVVAKRSIDRV